MGISVSLSLQEEGKLRECAAEQKLKISTLITKALQHYYSTAPNRPLFERVRNAVAYDRILSNVDLMNRLPDELRHQLSEDALTKAMFKAGFLRTKDGGWSREDVEVFREGQEEYDRAEE